MKKSEIRNLRNKISLASLAIVLISLPLGIIANNQTQNTSPKANLSDIPCQPDWNQVYVASESGQLAYQWPNSCKGMLPLSDTSCSQAFVDLNITEITTYLAWIDAGSPIIANICSISQDQNNATSSATPVIPSSPRPSPLSNQIRYETPSVKAFAEDFFIFVDDKYFFAKDSNIQILSDPPDSEAFAATTLQVSWEEHGVPMRWYVYFKNNDTHWWADEMRIYDGTLSYEQIKFTNQNNFFTSPLNTPYLETNVEGKLYISDDNSAAIFLKNTNLLAFRTDQPINSTIDINRDGMINIIDYSLFISGFISELNN